MGKGKRHWHYISATGNASTTEFRNGRHYPKQVLSSKVAIMNRMLAPEGVQLFKLFLPHTIFLSAWTLIFRYFTVLAEYASLDTPQDRQEIIQDTISDLVAGALVTHMAKDIDDIFLYADPKQFHQLLDSLVEEFPEKVTDFINYLVGCRADAWIKIEQALADWLGKFGCLECARDIKQKKPSQLLLKLAQVLDIINKIKQEHAVLLLEEMDMINTVLFCQECGQPYNLRIINEFSGIYAEGTLNTEQKKIWIPKKEGIRKLRIVRR